MIYTKFIKNVKFFSLLISVFVITFALNSLADELSTLSLDFCANATGENNNIMNMVVDPEVETGICYNVTNGSKNPLIVKVGFVDGTFTNDEWKTKACQTDTSVEDFGQYVTGYEQILTLQPGETINNNAKIKYPAGYDGLYHGCIVYSVVASNDTIGDVASSNFSIIMRKAKFIDVIVGDPSKIQENNSIVLGEFTEADGPNLSKNPKVRIYKDSSDDKYIVQLLVKNIGKNDENVTITGVAKNMVMYKNTFVNSRIITRGDSFLITQKLEERPSYNLKVKVNLSHSPILLAGMDVGVISMNESANIWIWNAITLITLIVILVVGVIIVLLMKDLKKKKVSKKSKKK